MVQRKQLCDVLSDFARTLATDFPIQRILDHLVERIVDVLPITAAGVTLIGPAEEPHHVAASDPAALTFEKMQSDYQEGPCLAAYRTGESVAVPDVMHDPRFRRFGPAAAAAGLGAVFTFPLRHEAGCLGALDLYRDVAGPLCLEDLEAAQTLADVATAYLLNAQARDEARSVSERHRHGALHDVLTGLPNRMLLQQRLEHAALRARRSHAYAAVLFADLDGFKQVNDIYGHHVGDQLLVAVAQRLVHLIRPGDTLCRYAGDEFVFLCEDLQDPLDAELLASRVEAAFSEPFRVDASLEVTMAASVGMAFAGPGDTITDQLLVEADTAMYAAKRAGGSARRLRAAPAPTIGSTSVEDLRRALADEELRVVYQPIVRTADGVVLGAEALLRWTRPGRGDIDAASVIGVAEAGALIGEVGAWVLTRACRDHASWRATPGGHLDLAVNVSPRQLLEPGFAHTVSRVLAITLMDPRQLVLEITEDILIVDIARATNVLDDLKSLGIRIALDDFGTGYSSLSYLLRLPIDIVKIDQSFIADVDRTTNGRALVAVVTQLAHLVGLTVVAEGVETVQQRDAVRAAGCEQSQGYLFARPQSAVAVADYLEHAQPMLMT